VAAATATYKLVKHTYTYLSKREGWNPTEVAEESWWVEGPGVYRPATVEEIDIGTYDLKQVGSKEPPQEWWDRLNHLCMLMGSLPGDKNLDVIETYIKRMEYRDNQCTKLPPCGLTQGHEGSCNTSKEFGK